MQQVQSVTSLMSTAVQDSTRIPPLTHQEAMEMCAEELRRFLSLIESLAGEDWQQPTACSLWTVKDVVAHQAAHVSSFTSLRSFLDQLNMAALRPYRKNGMGMLDAWNQSEVDRRRHTTPDALIAEIRAAAPRSLAGRERIPALVRGLTLPLPGLDQPRPLGYLFDLIYTRDMWMHRIDICRATGRSMTLDPVHDGRTVALVVRDLAQKYQAEFKDRAAVLELTGAAGGSYQIGRSPTPAAGADTVVEMDAPAFCVLTSGRDTAANVLTSKHAAIRGDISFGESLVKFSENRVLY